MEEAVLGVLDLWCFAGEFSHGREFKQAKRVGTGQSAGVKSGVGVFVVLEAMGSKEIPHFRVGISSFSDWKRSPASTACGGRFVGLGLCFMHSRGDAAVETAG
ncbi:MAG: hypothetical protein ACTHN5_14905 [Phycisphaerae bacterium]